jgi:hypothetical protein
MRQTKITQKEKNKNKQHKILSNKITTKKTFLFKILLQNIFFKS